MHPLKSCTESHYSVQNFCSVDHLTAVLTQLPHKTLQFCISEVILHFAILPTITSLVYLF